jgi:hypothetical protein
MIEAIVSFVIFILSLIGTAVIVLLSAHKDEIWYEIYCRFNWLKDEEL